MVRQCVVNRLATERRHVLLVSFLSQRRRHPRRRIEPGKRRHAIDAALRPFGETFPAKWLEVGELDVAPGFNVLSNVVEIFLGRKLTPLPTRRRDHTYQTIVEVYAVGVINHSHVVGAMGEWVGTNQVDVLTILKDQLLEGFQREACEVHGFGGDLLDLLLFSSADVFGDPSG